MTEGRAMAKKRPLSFINPGRDTDMKIKTRNSKSKRLKSVGFLSRSKTKGGKKIIKRKIRKSGKFRVG